MRDLFAWRPVTIDAANLEEAWHVVRRFGLSFWDALIVASARALGCQRLLTEDLQHEMDPDGVIVVNPFLVSPTDL